MNQNKINPIGEHFSGAEELLNSVPELKQKYEAIEKSGRKGFFPMLKL